MNLIDHHTHHRKKPQKSVAIHTYFILFNTDISITFYKSDVHNYVDKELVISDKMIHRSVWENPRICNQNLGLLWSFVEENILLWHPDCYQQSVSVFKESHVWKLGQPRVTDYRWKVTNVRVTSEFFSLFGAEIARAAALLPLQTFKSQCVICG